ncbi:hypothetical protein IFR04_002501 [Cadophora malorum]|uniref:Uncharacterized protein n=1 Tax=Cadophora malorum TaxID=108018 RepID=A0A8H8BUD3_9HELO|nr:hypothetical protein IFR04_002501 [Cadophora malorum]
MYEGAIQPAIYTIGCGVDAFDENRQQISAVTETGEMCELGTTSTLSFPEPVSHTLIQRLEFPVIVAILEHEASMVFDDHGDFVSDEGFQRRWSADPNPLVRFGYRGWPAATVVIPGTTDVTSTFAKL